MELSWLKNNQIENRAKTSKGQLRVLSQQDEWTFKVELLLLNEKKNRNGWIYKNLKEHLNEFLNTPILIAYLPNKTGDGHNFRLKYDPETGEEKPDFTGADAERICGVIPNDADAVSLVDKDGVEWVKCTGTIFAYYNEPLVKLLRVQGALEVSIETLVNDGYTEDDGTEVFTKWQVLGTTILGTDVPPAVPGAKIYRLSDMGKRFDAYKIRVAQYQEQHSAHAENVKTNGRENKKPMSLHAINKVQKRFADYKVLAVSEDEKFAFLMNNADNSLCTYCFDEADGDAIVAAKIMPAKAILNAEHGENSVAMDANDIVAMLAGREAEITARLNKAEKELEEANNTIKTMQEKEHERRIMACKSAVKRELAEINADLCMDERLDEKVLVDVEKDIEAGKFCTMEENGEWIGEIAACNQLKATCMDAVKKFNHQKAMNNRTVSIWDRVKDGDSELTGLEAALARRNSK